MYSFSVPHRGHEHVAGNPARYSRPRAIFRCKRPSSFVPSSLPQQVHSQRIASPRVTTRPAVRQELLTRALVGTSNIVSSLKIPTRSPRPGPFREKGTYPDTTCQVLFINDYEMLWSFYCENCAQFDPCPVVRICGGKNRCGPLKNGWKRRFLRFFRIGFISSLAAATLPYCLNPMAAKSLANSANVHGSKSCSG